MRYLLLLAIVSVSAHAEVTEESCGAKGLNYIHKPTPHCREFKAEDFRETSQQWLIREEQRCIAKGKSNTSRCIAISKELDNAN